MPYSPLQLAEALIQTGELQDALAALDQQMIAAPGDDVRRLRAAVLARMDENSRLAALADLDALQTLMPEDVILRSVLLERLGQAAQAVEALARGYAAFPDDQRLTERYIHLLRAQGLLPEARRIVSRWTRQDPAAWRWWQWAGDLAADAHDNTAAEAYYTQAIRVIEQRHRLEPVGAVTPPESVTLAILGIYAQLRAARGRIRARLNQLGAADADYAAAARLIPDDPVLLFKRGLLTARQGNLQQALHLCSAALDGANPILRQQMIADPEYKALLEA